MKILRASLKLKIHKAMKMIAKESEPLLREALVIRLYILLDKDLSKEIYD